MVLLEEVEGGGVAALLDGSDNEGSNATGVNDEGPEKQTRAKLLGGIRRLYARALHDCSSPLAVELRKNNFF